MTKLIKKQEKLVEKIKKTHKEFIKLKDELSNLFYLAKKEKLPITYLAKQLNIDKSAVYRRMQRSAKSKQK